MQEPGSGQELFLKCFAYVRPAHFARAPGIAVAEKREMAFRAGCDYRCAATRTLFRRSDAKAVRDVLKSQAIATLPRRTNREWRHDPPSEQWEPFSTLRLIIQDSSSTVLLYYGLDNILSLLVQVRTGRGAPLAFAPVFKRDASGKTTTHVVCVAIMPLASPLRRSLSCGPIRYKNSLTSPGLQAVLLMSSYRHHFPAMGSLSVSFWLGH